MYMIRVFKIKPEFKECLVLQVPYTDHSLQQVANVPYIPQTGAIFQLESDVRRVNVHKKRSITTHSETQNVCC